MRPVFALVATLVLVAGCGNGPAGGAQPRGWIVGVVLGGKRICPTPKGNDSLICHPAPLANGAFVVSGGGTTRHVHADAKGRFRVALPSGRYAIRPGWSRPQSIHVVAGYTVRVRVGVPSATSSGSEG